MKHYLSLLCFALTSFLYVNEAVANLLLKQNPTPLEPASYASSGESYQLAKVTWLPDYLGNNKSYGVNRVDDGGKDGNCGNMFANCPKNMSGRTVKHPIAGLTCYEECVCDETYYKYSSSNCTSPKILGGETCSDLSSKASEQTSSTEYYSECRCPSEYNLSTCPTNANCKTCDSKHMFVDCKDGYTNQNGTCVKVENCSAYPLTICPTGGTCSNCPDNSAKKKLDSCDTAQGWKLSGNTCVAIACPSGYSAGVETCTSGSTKPDISLSGWSGGQQCGLCKCNNIDTTCTAANYPVTSIPANAAKTSECSTGCGSEKVTRYTFTCNYGYELKDGKCEKKSSDCSTTSTPSAPLGQCPTQYGLQVNAVTAGVTGCYPCISCNTMKLEDKKIAESSCETVTYNESPGRQGTCYKCGCPKNTATTDDNCPSGRKLGTFLAMTLADGSKCYNCISACSNDLYTEADCKGIWLPRIHQEILSDGTICAACQPCSEYISENKLYVNQDESCPLGYKKDYSSVIGKCVLCAGGSSSGGNSSSTNTCPTTCNDGYLKCPTGMTPGRQTDLQTGTICCWKYLGEDKCPSCTDEELCKLYSYGSNGCAFAGYTKQQPGLTTSPYYKNSCYEHYRDNYYWEYTK